MDLHREVERLEGIAAQEQKILATCMKTAQDQIDDLKARVAALERLVDQHQRLGDYCPHTGR